MPNSRKALTQDEIEIILQEISDDEDIEDDYINNISGNYPL